MKQCELVLFFVRSWRIISVIGLVFLLINSYISYPAEVAVLFNSAGLAIQYLDRETLFYSSIAIFLVNNVLINSITRLIPKLPMDKIPVGPKWTGHRDELNEILINWFQALMAAVNTILALSLFVLSMLNRSDLKVDSYTYGWLLPLSAFTLASVIIALPIRLILMKPSSDNEYA